jgi:hypothetical protein
MKFAAMLMLLLSPALAAPKWEPFQFLVGDWVGEGSGQPGAGQGEFSFAAELGGQILVRRSFNQPASGPRHEDLMVVYLEPEPRAIYFDSEGHVIHYQLSAPAKGRAVFESSDAPGYRLTYTLDGKKLNGRFEVGGKTYLTWTSVPKR